MKTRNTLPLAAAMLLMVSSLAGCAQLGGAMAPAIAAKLGASGVQAAGWNPFGPKQTDFDQNKMQDDMQRHQCKLNADNLEWLATGGHRMTCNKLGVEVFTPTS